MDKKTIEQQIKRSGWASLTSKQKDYYMTAVEPTETATKERRGISEIIYDEACRNLGRDCSPKENEYGCMETVNTLLFQAVGKSINNSTSTTDGYKTMKSSSRFKSIKESEAERGTIIISPTGYSSFKSTKTVKKNSVECGHIGIMMGERVIASNDSKTSLFKKNYDILKWKKRWVEQGKYPIYFFRVLS